VTVFASAPLVFVVDLIVVSCACATSPKANIAPVMDNAIFIGSSSSAVVHDGGQYQCAVEVSVLTGWENATTTRCGNSRGRTFSQ
jgi:hypothetical protein